MQRININEWKEKAKSYMNSLPKPNLYTDVKFYRTNGMLLYSFKTLVMKVS